MKLITNFLRSFTMYQLMLSFLIVVLVYAFLLSALKFLPFKPTDLLFSVGFITVVAYITNKVLAKVFKVVTSFESVFITAFILSLVITPARNQMDFVFLFWAAVLAITSKFILAIGGRHIFNPAAIAVTITGFFLNLSASWWVGTSVMLPAITIGGLLVLYKIRKEDLVFAFSLIALVAIWIGAFSNGSNLFDITKRTLFDSPFVFFALVMLTEPRTTPATRRLRFLYGGLVGVLFSPYLRIGTFSTTPEIALVVGNVFSYVTGPRGKAGLDSLFKK